MKNKKPKETDNFPLVTREDCKTIAENTNYSPDYVYRIVRGYHRVTERNQVIIDEAKKITEMVIKNRGMLDSFKIKD
jgi:hypothetical protein